MSGRIESFVFDLIVYCTQTEAEYSTRGPMYVLHADSFSLIFLDWISLSLLWCLNGFSFTLIFAIVSQK